VVKSAPALTAEIYRKIQVATRDISGQEVLIRVNPEMAGYFEEQEAEGLELLSFEDTGSYRLLLPAMSDDAGELDRIRPRRARLEGGTRHRNQLDARRKDPRVRGVGIRLADRHLDADEDVRVPELHAGAPFRRLDERAGDAHLPGLVEAAAVDPLSRRREAVDMGPHQLGDNLFTHQIPSGPKSSSGGICGSGSTGPAAEGDSFRMSSRVTE